jgi:nitrite reductase/ring-hydroxylating ferredoxin subunit
MRSKAFRVKEMEKERVYEDKAKKVKQKKGKETHAWVERGKVSCYEIRCFHLFIPKTKKTRIKQRKNVVLATLQAVT